MAMAIDRMPRELVEKKAEEVLEKHKIFSAPVDPLVITYELGIDVNNAEFYDPNVAGLIKKKGLDDVQIFIKYDDHPNRKKFTIAHELGHYFLHLKDINGEFVDNDANFFRRPDNISTVDQNREVEANQFAAALLMPQRLVYKEWEDCYSVNLMAEKFGVSRAAMGNRLTNLGLI
jgi:Zn-dependent peptidase ImmA (M78 family)